MGNLDNLELIIVDIFSLVFEVVNKDIKIFFILLEEKYLDFK